MPNKAIVHIGLAKTGTTAIQTALAAARGRLSGAGVLFPLAGTINRQGGHHCVAWALGANQRLGAVCSGDVLGALANEIRNASHHTVLVSSEELSGISYNRSAIKQLISTLGTENLHTIVYIREQIEWFNSFYVEVLKDLTETRSIGEFVLSLYQEPRYHYDDWLALWQQSSSKFVVRPFLRKELVNGDVVADFIAAAGVNAAIPSMRSSAVLEANKALSAPRVAALLYLARTFQQFGLTPERLGPRKWTEHKRILLTTILEAKALDGQPYWGIGKEMAREVRDSYGPSNRAFLEKQGLRPTLFEETIPRALQTARLPQLDTLLLQQLNDHVRIMLENAESDEQRDVG